MKLRVIGGWLAIFLLLAGQSLVAVAAPNITSSPEGTSGFEITFDGTTATDLSTGNPISLAPATTTPVTLTSLTPSLASPQAPGTSITFTANASGGSSPLQYRFWLWNGGAWNAVQDYSTTNTWTWVPANPGDYYVSVWVKEQNSTRPVDVMLDPLVPYAIR